MANSEGAGAENLQKFESLLELSLNSLQSSYVAPVIMTFYNIRRSVQMVLGLVLDQYMILSITLG